MAKSTSSKSAKSANRKTEAAAKRIMKKFNKYVTKEERATKRKIKK